MNMYAGALLVLLALPRCGQAADRPPRVLVLDYADFGPPVMAEPLLGDEWNVWIRPGDLGPDDRFDVHVVVYQGDRAAIERAYPTVPGHSDYRLVTRSEAVRFLDRELAELAAAAADLSEPERVLRLRLEATRKRIAAFAFR
jgi:hypothetical protein